MEDVKIVSQSPVNLSAESPSMPKVTNMPVIMSTDKNLGFPQVSSPGGGSVDQMLKKKRGRPRKYDADGNLRASYSSPQVSSPGAFSITPGNANSSNYSRRSRGNYLGSENFHLLASLGELFASTAGADFMPHVVTVNTGEDVVSKILSFSHRGPRGICVLSANGAVSNVTIRQPGYTCGILTYEGRFEILSLSGSYTLIELNGLRTRNGGLSVSLAGPDGRVIGGSLAGSLTAASPIQIVVGSFRPNCYKAQRRKYEANVPTPATPISFGGNSGGTEEREKKVVNGEKVLGGAAFGGNSHDRSKVESSNAGSSEETKAGEQQEHPDINLSAVGE